VQEDLRRQCTPSLAEFRQTMRVRLPYLDPDYVDAVLRLAPTARLGAGVHRAILARNNPALLRVINGNTLAPAGAPDFVQQAYRRAGHLLRRLFGWQRFPHYVDVAAWLRGALREQVRELLLAGRTLDRGVFRPDGLRRIFERHQAGQDHGAALLALLGLEVWFRLFVDGDAPPPTGWTGTAPG
jgi:asparagine synthase (glutamine-hydrolysing)